MELPEPIRDLNEIAVSHHRRIWQPFMEKYSCKKIAEVGVFRGENFMRMIAHSPEIAVAVDAWKDGGGTANDARLPQCCLDEQFECFRAMTTCFGFVNIKRGMTTEIAKEYEDGYFDMIYIDADHSYNGCLQDIQAWYGKVRKGGFVLGDDYDKRGVRASATDFAKQIGKELYPIKQHGWAILV